MKMPISSVSGKARPHVMSEKSVMKSGEFKSISLII